MGRRLLMLWLLGGVFFGYGSALVELVHGSAHCHHREAVEAPAP